MCKTWPFIDDLLKNISLGGLPTDLKDQIRQRYDEHALEYALERQRENVPVNACIEKDTIKDIEEELVDACFNTLIMIFKHDQSKLLYPHNSYMLWSSLMDTWDKLELVRRTEGQP